MNFGVSSAQTGSEAMLMTHVIISRKRTIPENLTNVFFISGTSRDYTLPCFIISPEGLFHILRK
jgi:hypothetical protein